VPAVRTDALETSERADARVLYQPFGLARSAGGWSRFQSWCRLHEAPRVGMRRADEELGLLADILLGALDSVAASL
jgi:hypothetical protein